MLLCVLDCFVILLNIMPPMPPVKDAWDVASMALPFAIYFVLVGYALFPETYPSDQDTLCRGLSGPGTNDG
jgi:hypothetical protein